jgi:hypothetical protein
MSSVIIIYTSKLTEFDTVDVFDRSSVIKLLNPHAHAHIFHFEKLHRNEMNLDSDHVIFFWTHGECQMINISLFMNFPRDIW